MTKSQSITTANNWAYAVRGDKKSGFMELYCANQVLEAIIGSDGNYDVAFDALASLLQEWVKSRKVSLEKPIKRLAKALNLETATAE
jgi:hypothetical protein